MSFDRFLLAMRPQTIIIPLHFLSKAFNCFNNVVELEIGMQREFIICLFFEGLTARTEKEDGE